MAGWSDTQYNWRAAWEGEALEPLLDYCEKVKLVSEVGPGKKGSNSNPGYRHGTRAIPRKYAQGLELSLQLFLLYTDSAGAITHVDGSAGHVYENMSNIKRIFYGGAGLVELERTIPHAGTQSILVENLTPESHGEVMWSYIFTLYANDPFWRGAEVTQSGASILVGGNAPVDDAILTMGAGTVTHNQTGQSVTNSGGSADIDLSTGLATSGATDVSDQISFSDEGYMQLLGGYTNTFSGVSPSFTYRPKWWP